MASSATFQAIYLAQDGGISLIGWDNKKRDLANTQHQDARYFLASSMAVHPTEPLMAIGYIMPSDRSTARTGRDSILQLWNIDTGELLLETAVSEPGSNRLTTLAFSPDGTLLASGGADDTVRLWGVKQ